MATAAIFDPPDSHADLTARIAAIGRSLRGVPTADLCRRVDAIRNLAAARRLLPLAGLAAALRDALAREGRATRLAPWLDAMRESLETDAQDEAATRAFLASVGVRLG